MTMSVPQVTYYSERESHPVPENEEAFAAALETLDPRYILMSAFEEHPKWIYDVDPDEYGMVPARSFPDENPLLIVYEREP